MVSWRPHQPPRTSHQSRTRRPGRAAPSPAASG